jgi:hypothetical protein
MSVINKGRIEGFKYCYKCHNCDGTQAECVYCYALDTQRIKQEIKTARGQRYYALLKAFLSVEGEAICKKLLWIKKSRGRVLLFDVGYLSLLFGLNFKATCEWLEEANLVTSGIYELAMKHLTVKEIYEEARNRWRIEE